MRIKKVLLLVFLVLIVSGCSATYELEFKNNNLIEKTIINGIVSETSDEYEKKKENQIPAFEQEGNFLNERDFTIKYSDVKYYKKKSKLNSKISELSYKYKFLVKNYAKSNIANNSIKYFNFLYQGDNYVISTGSEIAYFDYHPELDDIKVHIKSNHKLIDTNADEVDGYNYYWYYDRNTQDKSIYLELSKTEKVRNYENQILKTIITVLLVMLVIGLISLYLYKRMKRLGSI